MMPGMKPVKFKEFFARMSEPERQDFARRCGTTVGHLTNVANGSRRASFPLCLAINRESAGEVTQLDMRRDAIEVWPELATEAA